MIHFTKDDLTRAVAETSALMERNKQRLIDMDSVIGDADLGLTMSKGYAAAKECAEGLKDEDIAARFKKIGFSISKAVPSTMGTLMATAFIGAGKALGKDKNSLTADDIGTMFMGMADAVSERGKAKEGEKTLLDVLYPVARAVKVIATDDITARMKTALDTAKVSLEKTKSLMSQHGKAAVFREKTVGLEDPGGAAAALLVEGFAKACGAA